MTPLKTVSKAATNVVPPAADAVVMGKPDLGYRPADMNAVFQVVVDGLDGGTFDVLFYPAGGPAAQTQEHQLAATETDTVLVDGPMVEAFRIEFAGLGAGAAPEVRITGQTRV